MYHLYIANKNYSSWSLRPWVLLRELAIPFVEHLVPFHDTAAWAAYRRVSPSGKVPCLIDDGTVVWDSLAIIDYVAEQHPATWPADRTARAWARSAAAEMHSGFNELRTQCSMNCGVSVHLSDFPLSLQRDIERLEGLWSDGLARFGGPYLTGSAFTAVDAFFAPVAFRVQTYDISLGMPAAGYTARLLALPAMRAWYEAAIAETFRDAPHEADLLTAGAVTLDRRAC